MSDVNTLDSNEVRTARMMEKLAKGEKIENRNDMSDEYYEHLSNLMMQQADSELAGAIGYLPWAAKAPTTEEMLVVSNITRDEFRHARAMYRMLENIGIETESHVKENNYSYRLEDSDANIGADRAADDKRVNIFYYPIETWNDFILFNFLMDRGAGHQLEDVKASTYGPWAREIIRVFKEEMTHVGHGDFWVRKLAADPATRDLLQEDFNKWYLRTINIFGRPGTRKCRRYMDLGLKQRDNQDVRQAWMDEIKEICEEVGLVVPEWNPDWETVPEEARISG